jgi:hypothetical protein
VATSSVVAAVERDAGDDQEDADDFGGRGDLAEDRYADDVAGAILAGAAPRSALARRRALLAYVSLKILRRILSVF